MVCRDARLPRGSSLVPRKQAVLLAFPSRGGRHHHRASGQFGPDTKPLNDDFQLLSRPHLGFVVGSVDEAIAELKRRKVAVTSEPRDVKEAGRRVAFFIDPWGNLVEVIEPIAD